MKKDNSNPKPPERLELTASMQIDVMAADAADGAAEAAGEAAEAEAATRPASRPESAPAPKPKKPSAGYQRQSMAEALGKSVIRAAGSEAGRRLARGLLGSLLKR